MKVRIKNEREKIKVKKVGSNTFEISNLEENDRIVLYDILGRKVKEVEGSSRIVLNNVSSGVYFLMVKRKDYIVFREKVYIVK
ncbi:MAG: T9SS type A sorting domain-containing protein [Candidatus Omnitrophica bacterium]|nr:T9SS type A sorting domain-containing protein [Candidatus Omnitrophota bacterium]